MVLGDGETCTGDPARRAGNEFLFQMQAMQNVEVLNEIGAKKIVVTCPHCMNTLGREYPQLGGNYEVVHHSQLLATLLREKRLTPVKPGRRDGHLPRPLLPGPAQQGLHPAARAVEVAARREPRGDGTVGREVLLLRRRWCSHVDGGPSASGSTCRNRSDEAIGTGASKVAVACPFCSVMLNDGVTARQAQGVAEGVQVVDLATVLLDSVR